LAAHRRLVTFSFLFIHPPFAAAAAEEEGEEEEKEEEEEEEKEEKEEEEKEEAAATRTACTLITFICSAHHPSTHQQCHYRMRNPGWYFNSMHRALVSHGNRYPYSAALFMPSLLPVT
jgi:hypothetical protein